MGRTLPNEKTHQELPRYNEHRYVLRKARIMELAELLGTKERLKATIKFLGSTGTE